MPTNESNGQLLQIKSKHIRIYDECEGRIEKIRPEDHRIFLSYPHTNNRLFFLLTTVF